MLKNYEPPQKYLTKNNMELKNQVVNLELSKKLKKLGVNQEGLFRWWIADKKYGGNRLEYGFLDKHNKYGNTISAHTVAELGEMLPEKTCWRGYSNNGNKWGFEFGDFRAEDATEANARAKMLIYLIENKLIKTT